MSTICTLHLSDLASIFPDWDQVLVYSDYFEDTNQLDLANALRWLHDHNHWPHPNRLTSSNQYTFVPSPDEPWIWWVCSPSRDNLGFCYYLTMKGIHSRDNDTHLLAHPFHISLQMSSLPPSFFRNGMAAYHHFYNSFSKSILSLSSILFAMPPYDRISHLTLESTSPCFHHRNRRTYPPTAKPA